MKRRKIKLGPSKITLDQIEKEIAKRLERKKHQKAVEKATAKDVRNALQWFFNEIKGELGVDGRAKSRLRRIPDSAFHPMHDPFIGGMFFFRYDAKHKDKLPYWDRFPLVIPIGFYADGFLGLNLHYLGPVARGKLLDALERFKRRANTPKAYMAVSYSLLKNTMNMELFQPCIHRYLTSHITTNIVKVKDEYWTRAAILPVQKFTGARDRDIWKKRK